MSNLGSVDVSTSPQEKFKEYLALQKKRLTPERAAIVDEVFSEHEHFDAEQLIERLTLRARDRRVSRATIYRTLSQLEEAGLLRKVARTNDREIYEHDYGYPQHDHLICKKCGQLEEFHNEQISDILKMIADEHGFIIEGHRLEVTGICSSCKQPAGGRHRKLDMI